MIIDNSCSVPSWKVSFSLSSGRLSVYLCRITELINDYGEAHLKGSGRRAAQEIQQGSVSPSSCFDGVCWFALLVLLVDGILKFQTLVDLFGSYALVEIALLLLVILPTVAVYIFTKE